MTIRNVLIAVVGAAVIAGAAGCGTSSTPHQTSSNTATATTPGSGSAAATKSSAQPPGPPAPGAQSGCAAFGGTVGPDQTCHAKSSASNYKLDMTYPLDYPDQRAVADFLTQERDGFLDWIAKYGPSDGRDRPYEDVVTAKTYRSGTPTAGTQSLVLKIEDDAGLVNQDHPDTMFEAFNYDIAKRAPITFDTLFKPGTKPLEVLNPIVQRELDAPADNLKARVYQNFAITDDALIFFFGQDEVIRDNNGPHQVSVPRTELAPLLA
jgi:Protein of unknown function (DUF3298)